MSSDLTSIPSAGFPPACEICHVNLWLECTLAIIWIKEWTAIFAQPYFYRSYTFLHHADGVHLCHLCYGFRKPYWLQMSSSMLASICFHFYSLEFFYFFFFFHDLGICFSLCPIKYLLALSCSFGRRNGGNTTHFLFGCLAVHFDCEALSIWFTFESNWRA